MMTDPAIRHWLLAERHRSIERAKAQRDQAETYMSDARACDERAAGWDRVVAWIGEQLGAEEGP